MYWVGVGIVATGLCAGLDMLPGASQRHPARVRKIVSKVTFTYPPLAKHFNIKKIVMVAFEPN